MNSGERFIHRYSKTAHEREQIADLSYHIFLSRFVGWNVKHDVGQCKDDVVMLG